jgi:hypothetical protein
VGDGGERTASGDPSHASSSGTATASPIHARRSGTSGRAHREARPLRNPHARRARAVRARARGAGRAPCGGCPGAPSRDLSGPCHRGRAARLPRSRDPSPGGVRTPSNPRTWRYRNRSALSAWFASPRPPGPRPGSRARWPRPLPMEQCEAPHPLYVRLLRPVAAVPRASSFPHAIEQPQLAHAIPSRGPGRHAADAIRSVRRSNRNSRSRRAALHHALHRRAPRTSFPFIQRRVSSQTLTGTPPTPRFQALLASLPVLPHAYPTALGEGPPGADTPTK